MRLVYYTYDPNVTPSVITEVYTSPMYINASDGEDGSPVELQLESGYLQWKLTSETTWTNIVPLTDLKVKQVKQEVDWRLVGIVHWITEVIVIDNNTGCNSCNPCNTCSGVVCTVGNHQLVTADVGTGINRWHKYTSTDATWTQTTTDNIGEIVYAWSATANVELLL